MLVGRRVFPCRSSRAISNSGLPSFIFCALFLRLSRISYCGGCILPNLVLAINAIRDDEDKAEAMGIPTLVYKRIGWGVAALFMGAIGAVAGNMAGFIDKEVAYPIPTFGIFMVAMVLLVAKARFGGQYWARLSSML